MTTTAAPTATPETPAPAAPLPTPIADRCGVPGMALATDALAAATRKTGPLGALKADTGHAVVTEIRPGFDTASWSFDGVSHRVVLGDRFAEAIQTFPTTDAKRCVEQFATELLRHEAWHGRITHRDLRAIAMTCRSKRVPFILFNLFEDARIEEQARIHQKRKFGWQHWIRLTHTASEPLAAFYSCVVAERPMLALDTLSIDPSTGKRRFSSDQDDKVRDFYERATRAASSFAIIDLCQEWMAYWRSDAGGKRPDGGTVARPGSVSTLQDGIGEEQDGSVAESREAGAKAQEEDDKKRAAARDGHRIVSHSGATGSASVRQPLSYYSGSERHPVNATHVTRLAQRMHDVIVAAASRSTARLATSGSRLHVAALASQSESAFRAPGKRGGIPHLVTVVDMSGSMGAEWTAHGRLFTAAILRLLREGRIHGHVVLTGGDSHAIVPNTISDADFNRLAPDQRNETIAHTLDAVRDLITQAHYTIVYTDGQITDGSVDAKRWRMRGVELVGACIVPPEGGYNREAIVGAMRTHFGNAVMASTGEALALALVAKLGNLSASR